MYLYIDMDAFFVSAEVRRRKGHKNKCVIVGNSDHPRAVVSSASYEARKRGVHAGMPLRKAKILCPKAIFYPPDMKYYVNLSLKVEKLLQGFSPKVYRLSIDEFVLDARGMELFYETPYKMAEAVKSEIKDKLALPCSIGIAETMTVAKIACKNAKPDGIFCVEQGQAEKFMEDIPVGDFPGIGKTTEKKLKYAGIYTIGDIVKSGVFVLRKILGVYGTVLYLRASGRDVPVVPLGTLTRTIPKSIGREVTFYKDVYTLNEIKKTLFEISKEIARQLRKHKLFARQISVKVKYSNFKVETRNKKICNTTAGEIEIFLEAGAMFNEFFKNGEGVRLVGIRVYELIPLSEISEFLLPEQENKFTNLGKALDYIHQKYGDNKLKFGVRLLS